MKILRAGAKDTDIFSKAELAFGACCFFSENREYKYFFEIEGRNAVLRSDTDKYISEAIDEFLFYSGFIVEIKDCSGRILFEKKQNEPYLYDISKIQPSQFYISQGKLENCKKWISGNEDIFIPIVIKDETAISLDGHTRLRAALDLGYTCVYVYPEECDEMIFHFVDEAIKRRITNVFHMDILSDEEYEIKWNKFCEDFFNSQAE